ncbi:hypothetical protein K432DRAFT_409767 [Lepidopterella palustris CBS 459.81]|uniref:Prenylcysteine lyase domain-containing protein n=1 Tax=Lepidopterella palustris CBS 459.81 TaxID=1314670 RepID=A0A8E2DZU5_9PEZI|nr:hypothetical protein K432DRAFT_409767 [Lepidopterella palustris CBS 459.81]
MKLPLTFSFSIFTATVIARDVAQSPIDLHITEDQTRQDGRKRIAIVGGGISAASLAYSLYADYGYLQPMDLTIYEVAARVGGRVNLTLVDNLAYTYGGFVDTGASTFSANDWCLQTAIDNAGLRRDVVEGVPSYQQPTAGVWDGQTFVLRRDQDLKSRTQLEYARDIFKYGLSAWKLQKFIRDNLPLFHSLYSNNQDPNPNLPDAVRRLSLEEESRKPAGEYFMANGVPPEIIHNIIQPSVRALFEHNLRDLNAVSALIAMNPAATYRLESEPRGNLELVTRLIRLSEARTLLNTHVSMISRSSNGKYTMVVPDTDPLATLGTKEKDGYDAVVIATHLQGAGIELDFPAPFLPKSLPEFVERHVTHFSTRQEIRLAPSFFNLTIANEISDLIFTTSGSRISNETDIFTVEHYDSDGFSDDMIEKINIYKTISSGPISDSMILQMLGYSPDSPLQSSGVIWIDRQVWPLASPKHTRGPQLDNVELANGVFYMGLLDELLSSMEMSCRMGCRVAHMVYRKLRSPMCFAGHL